MADDAHDQYGNKTAPTALAPTKYTDWELALHPDSIALQGLPRRVQNPQESRPITEFEQRLAIMKEVSGQDALAFIVRFCVYFHARNPRLSRLMSQEATLESWRLTYLIDRHIRPSTQQMEKLVQETEGLSREAFVHWYYIMISSTSTIFSFAAECEALFGVDPCKDEMVERHAEMLVSMLLNKR